MAAFQEVTAVFFTTQCFFFPFSKTWMWTSVEHMRDNCVLNPSPVSRSSASSRYCSGGIRLSAHHFRYLQLPHLQVSLIASSCCFLSVLLSTQTLEIWYFWWIRFFFLLFLSTKESKKKRERHVWSRINGLCFYRCQCGIYTIVAVATAQQVTELKQRCSVFELPSELIYQPQQPILQFSLNDH